MNHSRLYWWCQFAGWGGLFLASALFERLSGRPASRVMVATLAVCAAGLIATHFVRSWIRSHRWLRARPGSIALRVAGASLFVGLSLALAGALPARWASPEASSSHTFLWMAALGTGVGLAWVSLYLAARAFDGLERERRRASELEAASREAELAMLKSQLDPHFMFNSLNSIRSLIEEDPGRARDAVTHLAGVMRTTTSVTEATTVPLASELATVASYLELEAMRFEERLTTEIDVSPSLGDVPVPPFLLQTLVENAIKHGISRCPDGGSLLISGRRKGDELELEVRNSGSLGVRSSSSGVGLENLRRRLQLLYDGRGQIVLREDAGVVIATVVLPTRGPVVDA